MEDNEMLLTGTEAPTPTPTPSPTPDPEIPAYGTGVIVQVERLLDGNNNIIAALQGTATKTSLVLPYGGSQFALTVQYKIIAPYYIQLNKNNVTVTINSDRLTVLQSVYNRFDYEKTQQSGAMVVYNITQDFLVQSQPNFSDTQISEDINWQVTYLDYVWSTHTATGMTFNLIQHNQTAETSTFSNLTAIFTTDFSASGLLITDAPVDWFSIDVYNVTNPKLSMTGDTQLIKGIVYEFVAVDANTYKCVLKAYPANFTSKNRTIDVDILGQSTTTGEDVYYVSPALVLHKRQPFTQYNPDLNILVPVLSDISFKGLETSITLQYTDATSNISIDVPEFVSIKQVSTSTSDDITTSIYSLKVSPNLDLSDRYGYIQVTSTYAGSTSTKNEYISQIARPPYTECTTWNDMTFNYATSVPVTVTITLSDTGDTIFEGTAYPINNMCTINFRDIIDNYIENDILFNDSTTGIATLFIKQKAYRSFTIKIDGTDKYLFNVVYNWSYDNDCIKNISNNERGIWLNRPIQNIIDGRQYIFMDRFRFENDSTGVLNNASLIVYDDSLISQQIGVLNLTVPNGEFKTGCMRLYNPTTGSYLTNAKFIDLKHNVTKKRRFNVCWAKKYKYCLYYINKYGATDWYLFSDYTKEKRTVKNDTATFGKNDVQYNKTSKQGWNLKTELLTDEQSKLMQDMFESTSLQLHNLETNEIIPVNITDSAYEIKNYHNNGRKKYYYTINVEAKQTRNISI